MKKHLNILTFTLLMSTTAFSTYSVHASSSSNDPFGLRSSKKHTITVDSNESIQEKIAEKFKKELALAEEIGQTLEESIGSLKKEITDLNEMNRGVVPLDVYGRPLDNVPAEHMENFLTTLTMISQKSVTLGVKEQIRLTNTDTVNEIKTDIDFYENKNAPAFLRALMNDFLTYRQICTTPIWIQGMSGTFPFNAAPKSDQEHALTMYPMRDHPVNLDEQYPLVTFVISRADNRPKIDFGLMEKIDDFSRNILAEKLGRISEQYWTQADQINSWIQHADKKKEQMPSHLTPARKDEAKASKKRGKMTDYDPFSTANKEYEKKKQKRQEIEEEKNFLDQTINFFDDIMAVVRTKGQIS